MNDKIQVPPHVAKGILEYFMKTSVPRIIKREAELKKQKEREGAIS